jgi:guanyl-specific ribonuclease Sa
MGDKIKIDVQMDAHDKKMLFAAFKTMPKEAQDVLRKETQKLVGVLAEEMKTRAATAPNPQQAMLLARSIKANKDRVPSITVGGARKVPVKRKKTPGSPQPTNSDFLFGAEFGVRQGGPGSFKQGGRKFAAYSGRMGKGSRGYFIFPTLRKNQEKIRRDYLETVYKLLKRKWGPDK